MRTLLAIPAAALCMGMAACACRPVRHPVPEPSWETVTENGLMTLMVTHNMRDAIRFGNRLIMMNEGRVILDISGEEKKRLTVEMLMDAFAQASGEAFANDRILLS